MGQGMKLSILGALIGVLGFASYKVFLAKPDAPTAAAPAANDIPTCTNGTLPCPNPYCLTREKEGWRPMHVPGHPDTDLWMTYVDVQGRRSSFNQHHIGHVIEPVNGVYTDTGVCPVCKGRALVCR